jgi:hypothetical protein
MNKFFSLLAVFFGAFLPQLASAHEVYVLTKNQIASSMQASGLNIFDSLRDPHNLKLFFTISIGIGLAFLANLFFRHSAIGAKLRGIVEKGHVMGPIFVRLAVATSFFYSAATWSFLGPELSLHDFPYGGAIRIILYALSAMFLLGIFVEVASLVGLGIFILAIHQYGWYMLAYFNYFGEFIVLILFGLRVFSFDRLFFGKGNRLQALEKYKTTVVRVCYGVALGFAAIYVKFLHPALTYTVVTEYKLTQYHWLFPGDPLFVVLGAALSELAIAICIIIGFQLRFVVLISLFYITLSLLFFKEAVWPHYLLYGISLNLIFDKEVFTFDNLIDKYWPFGRKKVKGVQ